VKLSANHIATPRDLHLFNLLCVLKCARRLESGAGRMATVLADQVLAGREPDAFTSILRHSGSRCSARDVRHIADIHVMQPLGVGNRLGPFQGRHRRDGQVLNRYSG